MGFRLAYLDFTLVYSEGQLDRINDVSPVFLALSLHRSNRVEWCYPSSRSGRPSLTKCTIVYKRLDLEAPFFCKHINFAKLRSHANFYLNRRCSWPLFLRPNIRIIQ